MERLLALPTFILRSDGLPSTFLGSCPWPHGEKTQSSGSSARFSTSGPSGLHDRFLASLPERFASGGEAAQLAFAALVERHGAVVLQTCRSILRDEHEAEDAFQATFLTLVRKARSLWVRDSLGPWLHQVAYRAARCSRSAAARRTVHERRAAEMIAGRDDRRRADDGKGADFGAAIHEEIERLPERYRVAVVLCDLEGRTHEQAARHLGCPVGTVKSRLARGRVRLRDRLTRRGLTVPAGVVVAGLHPRTIWVAPAASCPGPNRRPGRRCRSRLVGRSPTRSRRQCSR